MSFFNIPTTIATSPYVPSARTVLMTSLFLLLSMSLLMIASASVPFAMTKGLSPMTFFYSQATYIIISLVAGMIVYRLPLKWYFEFGLLALAWGVLLGLLILTLAIGTVTNGSQRWLNFGVFNFQTSEFVKLLMVLVIADYVVRRSAEVRGSLMAGWRLTVWYLPMIGLILWQPDYGSVAVIIATASVILFVSGVPLPHYAALVLAVFLPALIYGLLSSDYRKERIMSFLNPFDDVQDTDYQLSRSLIAFGRGEFNGVGYGNSVQKLSHLPEAHTDFILAITGEELGFLGVAFVLLLEVLIVAMIMKISHTTLKRRQLRLSYMVFGFGVVIFGQVLINAGMNMGLMPPKGLTLPFYSFGGSSMLMVFIMIAMILKADKESERIYLENKNREY
ncbi:FtsW/RodA/SpoVE family cell cycle protein [Moraxella nonliquefaciens]|jgi:cell cycle family protein ftsW|uniref:Probable peptidoglycan glycosyltransferase FtsW n=1 Tax=Moraxella nonliquefaciens TaxID=478 RepID=A0A7T3F027_MORNO|nr:putative peptidoglycan glycosyltransferase FtsW [Moraxella nonliquefaciens]MCG7412427.1 putative lipid II flippase FtsW [Moraxella nonliquefaciens]QPT44968.1 cell division protein FtsW [Moraxella nonliquefaciens]QQC29999.1 cell division protein FtsW [Moraxella nonliquefaciens]